MVAEELAVALYAHLNPEEVTGLIGREIHIDS